MCGLTIEVGPVIRLIIATDGQKSIKLEFMYKYDVFAER